MAENDNKLRLRYVPLATVARWDLNPKLHDIGKIQESIRLYGFGDPPKYDGTLGALVYGNGRTEALERMQRDEEEAPRGVVRTEAGEWLIPVIFGVDQDSREMAERFAVDHNSLTLGPSFGGGDVSRLWDPEGIADVARGWELDAALVVPLPGDEELDDAAAIQSVLGMPDDLEDDDPPDEKASSSRLVMSLVFDSEEQRAAFKSAVASLRMRSNETLAATILSLIQEYLDHDGH